MISFNPYERPTAEEALSNSIFDDYREEDWEIVEEEIPRYHCDTIDENLTLEEGKNLLIWELQNNPNSIII